MAEKTHKGQSIPFKGREFLTPGVYTSQMDGLRDKTKTVRFSRSQIIQLLKEQGVPISGCCTVEVERGCELINVNDADMIVVSWG